MITKLSLWTHLTLPSRQCVQIDKRVPVLGDDAFKAMLAGKGKQPIAVGFDLFRQAGEAFSISDERQQMPASH